jgi:rubrerythrin
VEKEQVRELLLQALETERGGIEVYETALTCAVNDELREEWGKYLDQTRNHERIVRNLLEQMDVDPEEDTPGRRVVRRIGEGLVAAIDLARAECEPEAAEIVAAECVVLAETKDHLNWELVEAVAVHAKRSERTAFAEAYEQVEEEEDKHLYHSSGWCRELWLQSLGLPAVLPPPEEEKDVTTAIGAARAKQHREEMM